MINLMLIQSDKQVESSTDTLIGLMMYSSFVKMKKMIIMNLEYE